MEFGGRQTIMANFRELRDPFTLYHSSGVINGKEFILEDIGRVTTMFTKPPPPLYKILSDSYDPSLPC